MRWPIAVLSAFLLTPPLLANDKIAPLLPERTIAVLHLDVRELLRSPLGKKIVGDDNLATLLRKVVGEEAAVKLEKDSNVAAFLNRIVSVTFVSTGEIEVPTDIRLSDLDRNATELLFIESANTEADYIACVEELLLGPATAEASFVGQIAKATRKVRSPIRVETIKNRSVLVLTYNSGLFGFRVYGAKLSDSLFVWSANEELLLDVLDRKDNKKKFGRNDALIAAMKKIDAKESPVWFAHGREFRGIGLMTTNLKKDLELNYLFRGEDGLGNFLVGKVTDGLKELSASIDEKVKDNEALAGIKAATAREKNTVTGKLTVPEKLLTDLYKTLK